MKDGFLIKKNLLPSTRMMEMKREDPDPKHSQETLNRLQRKKIKLLETNHLADPTEPKVRVHRRDPENLPDMKTGPKRTQTRVDISRSD